MYRLSFWGNTGNVEMDGGWIILGPAYRGIWDQDNFGIYANSSDWTFYQAEKDLHLGEVDSLRIQIMVGGIRYDDVQIDGLEVVAYPLLGSQSVTEVPTAFCLGPAFPNPFNPATTIHFNLPISTNVRLMVYDLLGREVVRLVEGYMEPGYHQVRWDGRNASGGELTSGIYVARLITPEYSTSIKMVLMK
ncbi:MAG: T9SS type A sorting domain-containing protein [Fidelibacterota bacterium]|nr:MAG: T9SS type A sorting domain-containing protein [Candidatus Neomarinimicrobiota bacterium]